jgi:6-pyruvoyltetrahydropterin/6-carboxytetrahydropterin synthase
MVTIQTSVDFEAAHRQYGDDSKCGFLHGHNWKVDFVLQGDKVNSVGYLENFTVLKRLTDGMDHKVILKESDPLVQILRSCNQLVYPTRENPTCENIATLLCNSVMDVYNWKLGPLTMVSVTVWENDVSKATVTWTPERGLQ